jgi:DNA-binding CsgD family transcriptional regulator
MKTSIEKTVINLIAAGYSFESIMSQTNTDKETVVKISEDNRKDIRIRRFFHLMKEGCTFRCICKKLNISPEEGNKIYMKNKEFFSKSLKEQMETEEEISRMMDEVAIAYLKYNDLLAVYQRVRAVLDDRDTMVNKSQALAKFKELSDATFEALEIYTSLLKEVKAKAGENGELAEGSVQKFVDDLKKTRDAREKISLPTPEQLTLN